MPPQVVQEALLPSNDSKNSLASLSEAPILRKSRHLLNPNGSIVGSKVAECILPEFGTFCSAIPFADQPQPALASVDGRHPLTHARVYDFCVREFGTILHGLGFGKGDRIALVLPNGPELALALVATAHWGCAVPLNANGASSELEADLLRCGADLVIGPYSGTLKTSSRVLDGRFHVPSAASKDWSAFGSVQESAKKLGIPFCGMVPSNTEAGVFALVSGDSVLNGPVGYEDIQQRSVQLLRRGSKVPMEPNGHDDEVLVLFTSGTTGNKKLVPHLMGDMLTAATTIALSWDLGPTDVNCNLMPLFHVGGIVRQIFSPLFSGGCVICCPSFDPNIFWYLLEKHAFSWYYAAPTMHQLILQTGKADGYMGRNLTLRMIANAAGGLLPSLAEELMDVFQANVLPSYGMTECMPISSPPATYQLDKPGTSGVPVGPEVAILDTATVTSLPPNTEGPICVRGAPCFRGYGALANDPTAAKPASFLEGGWFNTGDLGYLDEDGYLYITGRSKEVINRGGEIISPMEVEEAITSHPDVTTCAAFSALHDVMQEVVGVAIVMKADRPRLDLPTLHEFLGDKLAAPKWPQCLVFMDGLPKSHTNKLLRVKLGSRFGLPELTDTMTVLERTFEATCPTQGAPLDEPIPANRVLLDASQIEYRLKSQLETDPTKKLMVVVHPHRTDSLVCYLADISRRKAVNAAVKILDRYAVPSYFVETSETAFAYPDTLPVPQMADAVASILQGDSSGPVDPVVRTIQELFTKMLNLDYLPAPDKNFFHLGGSSMLASQLASQIRKCFGVACNGSEVFQHATAKEMAKLIRHRSDSFTTTTDATNDDSRDSSSIESRSVSDQGAPFETKRLPLYSSLSATIFQLVPMFIVYPIWQVTRYLLFFRLLLWSIENTPGSRDIGKFVVAYLAFHTIWITVTPLVFVAIKWIVIGRYRPGRYPIYGQYYLRWWFVDVCRKLFLRGIWGSHDVLLNAYYRMLGAKIGPGAEISPECDVAEFDLVEIGAGASLEMATVRGFGVDNGAMILGPVKVGRGGSVGWKSVIAPYTSIPDNGHLGPIMSSYEKGSALDELHARFNRRHFAEPDLWVQVFVGGPITFMVNAFGQIPPLFVLFLMLQIKGEEDDFTALGDMMRWLCQVERIKYYIGIRVARAVLSPFFYMAAAIFVKRFLIGKFEAGPRNTTDQWALMRHWLSASLFSRKKIQSVTDIVGRHYELVSCLYRLLGAKVGKRVFWPGHQPVFSGEFDLLEIGDDVVFGSRSAIFMATTDSYEKVILCSGSNVADNCLVLPGSILGKNAVLGSNSVCPAGWYLPESSVWLGSRGGEPMCLEQGTELDLHGHFLASEVKPESLRMRGDATTLRPFGNAFYGKMATYFVWPLEMIVSFTVVVKTLVVMLHTLPLLGALHCCAATLYGWTAADRDYEGLKYSYRTVYFTWLFMYLFTNLARVCVWVGVELAAKWTLMGRRREGQYNYDTSSYAQRWELYQIIGKIRKFSRMTFLDFFSGTPFMAAYFRWNGGKIGKNCCLYPTGADPFMPEPDLVIMGNECVIDCASIVCHLNTRGNFELSKIVIENNCTLRVSSRVQQGVYMEEGSQLLEKSFALTGEVLEAHSVWQGCPASWWFQNTQQDGDDESLVDESTTLLRGRGSTYH